MGKRRGSKLLTDRDLRATKPGDAPLYDGDGLRFVPAKEPGRSYAQLKFTRPEDGEEDILSLGVYPVDVSLATARDKAQAARELLALGTNPKKVKRAEKIKARVASANTFAALAARWVARQAREQRWSERHARQVRRYIQNHLGELDDVPVTEIRAAIVAPIRERLEVEAPGMAPRAVRRLDSILDYGVQIGVLSMNPLPRRERGKRTLKHFAAVVDLPGIGAILRVARERPAPTEAVNRAHQLLTFTAQRIGEVIGARWDEFDLEAGTWAIARSRMKRKDEARGAHIIALPPQLLRALREWRKVDGEGVVYVCHGKDPRRPVGPDTVGIWYRDALGLKGQHSPHSWRSALSTVANEAGKPREVIEAQLDHVVGNQVSSAYDRSARLEQRRVLMTWYERTLLAARDGAAVIPLAKRGR